MAEVEKRARNDDVLTNEDEEDEVKNGNDGDKKSAAAGPISFGFSKTVGKSKVQNLNREATETSEEKDYLTGVEGKELKSTKPSEKPKELVIPLIHKNRWYKEEAGSKGGGVQGAVQRAEQPPEEDVVESLAVKELIEESQRQQEKWKSGGSQGDPNLSIPLLLMNKVPSGFEDGDKVNVDMRPESSTEADYEMVPVEAYGMAMLKGMGWKIEGVDPDNARVMVRLAIGGKTVTVSQYCLRLVNRKEYEKNSRDLSRLSKAHKEREKMKTDEEKERLSNAGAPDKHTDRERDRDQRGKDRKRKHQSQHDRDRPHAGKEPRQSSSNTGSSHAPCWLQRDLRVRFIDKKFKGGKYYNSKMTIEDVLSPEVCVCRSEEGRLLDDVKQSMLETVVPKSDSDFIMVVLGQNRGQVGRILQRDKEKGQALVQLQRSEEQVFKLDYDAVCHYVGGTDD
ncbi:G patch domain and KOW motifs-containing protein [Acipenser ruthenus]|uniref:G-patch domain and KOW motifs-containing protein n=1 Tax=Acipenser ruthenus TaxID=7906 RepID=A0A662YQY9_ACIRT|nr:G patch domain and KOW motifs-containing protein [Acipenser ruthenus]